MKEWTVKFEDAETSVVVEAGGDSGMLERFDTTEKTMMIGDRKVQGMWIEDKATEQVDVPRACGLCGSDIWARHNNYKTRAHS
jgi:hypothetical protein